MFLVCAIAFVFLAHPRAPTRAQIKDLMAFSSFPGAGLHDLASKFPFLPLFASRICTGFDVAT